MCSELNRLLSVSLTSEKGTFMFVLRNFELFRFILMWILELHRDGYMVAAGCINFIVREFVYSNK